MPPPTPGTVNTNPSTSPAQANTTPAPASTLSNIGPTEIFLTGVPLGSGTKLTLDPFSHKLITPTLEYASKDSGITASATPKGITELSKSFKLGDTGYTAGLLSNQANSRINFGIDGQLTPSFGSAEVHENFGGGVGLRAHSLTATTDIKGSTSFSETTAQLTTSNTRGNEEKYPTVKIAHSITGRDHAYGGSVYISGNAPAASLSGTILHKVDDVDLRGTGNIRAEKGNNAASLAVQASKPLIDDYKGYAASRVVLNEQAPLKKEAVLGVARSIGTSMMDMFVQGHVGDGKPKVEIGISIGDAGIARKVLGR